MDKEQAWNMVADNLAVIDRAVRNSPKINGVDHGELHSYAYEAAFRAACKWDPERGPVANYLYRASQRGAIDGVREVTKFYGYRRRGSKLSITTVPDDDISFWETHGGGFDSDEVVAYLSLMELLEPLNEYQRKVAFLTYSERWTPSEIADHLGVTSSTISQTRSRLLERLREKVA